jgi:hypothetical protein
MSSLWELNRVLLPLEADALATRPSSSPPQIKMNGVGLFYRPLLFFSHGLESFILLKNTIYNKHENESKDARIIPISVWLDSMVNKIVCLVIVSNRLRAGLDFSASPHGNYSSLN